MSIRPRIPLYSTSNRTETLYQLMADVATLATALGAKAAVDKAPLVEADMYEIADSWRTLLSAMGYPQL